MFAKADAPAIRWTDTPKPEAFDNAGRVLGLTPDADRAARLLAGLRVGHLEMRRAEDVQRISGEPALPASDPGVKRHMERIRAGKRLRPILVTVTPTGTRVVDGAHRLSAVVHLDEQAPVALIEATDLSNPSPKRETKMSKKSIIKKVQTEIETLAKEEKRLRRREEAMTDLQALRKRGDDLDHETRASIRKSGRELQASYLQEASPAAYEAWRAQRRRAGLTDF